MHIRNIPNITISDHVKGDALNFETPEPSVVDLVIDKGKKWAFLSDDVTKAQADYNYVESWTGDAAMQMKIAIERAIFADIYADVDATNTGLTAGALSAGINLGVSGTPFQLTKANIVDKIVECGQALGENNIPEEDRFIIIPKWARTLLMGSDLKAANLTGDSKSMLRTGRLDLPVDNFNVYSSNLLSTVTDGAVTATRILFGHKSALTFASQLVENEGPMRHPNYFGDFYRGLQVYGYKVVKPDALGMLYAYK